MSVLNVVALRQARRDRQLVSKRLLLNDDEDQPEVTMDTNSGEQVRQTIMNYTLVGQAKLTI